MKLKSNICLFCLLFLSFQSGGAQISIQLDKPLLQYYQLINKAEMSIVKGKSKDALKFYSKAFKYFPNGFPFDYRNAYLLAIKVKDNDLSKAYAAYLIQHGVCKEFFRNFPLTMDSIQFSTFYASNSILAKINYEYRDALMSLSDKDQGIRESGATREIINKVDSIDYEAFKILVNKYQFPAIENIGVMCAANSVGFNISYYDILLLHFSQHKYPGFLEILTDALKSGAIENNQYARYLSFFGDKELPRYGSNPIYRIDGKFYEDIGYSYSRNKIDKNRKAIGLSTYKQQLENYRFKNKNPDSILSIPGIMNQINGIDARILKAFKPFEMNTKSKNVDTSYMPRA